MSKLGCLEISESIHCCLFGLPLLPPPPAGIDKTPWPPTPTQKCKQDPVLFSLSLSLSHPLLTSVSRPFSPAVLLPSYPVRIHLLCLSDCFHSSSLSVCCLIFHPPSNCLVCAILTNTQRPLALTTETKWRVHVPIKTQTSNRMWSCDWINKQTAALLTQMMNSVLLG